MGETTFEKRLKLIREQRGWSQRELAERCGLGEQQIWRYENGTSDPSARFLARIASELHISADYLLGLVDEPVEQYHGTPLSPQEHQMVTALRNHDVNGIMEIWLEVSKARRT